VTQLPVRVIAVPLKEFAGWGGGIDFIRLILEGLVQDRGLRVVALVPRPGLGRRLRQGLGRFLERLRGRPAGTRQAPPRPEAVVAAIADFLPRITIRLYPDGRRGLCRALRRARADVALPCLRPLPPSCPVPWVGYLYDFQHQHLPELFSAAERAGRDAEFARMLARAAVVICNSEAVRADAERFRPGCAGRIIALPFAPVPRREWFDLDVPAARLRHALPERYFIICNQFWVHKDHATAIRAFAAFRAGGGDPDAALVCTGHPGDYRAPGHAAALRALIAELGLGGRVHLLGHLPKSEQIALLRGAIGVLQPTRFEGGRGGGAVLEALAMGVPALVSDIAVNREIVHAGCRFFATGDPAALAARMLELASHPAPRPEPAELLRRAEAGLGQLGASLAEAIARARFPMPAGGPIL